MAKKSTKRKTTHKKKSTKKVTYSNGIVNAKKTSKGYKQEVLRSIHYDVYIGGKLLGLDRKECIEKISIVETVDGSDSCVIQIADPDMLYINDNL